MEDGKRGWAGEQVERQAGVQRTPPTYYARMKVPKLPLLAIPKEEIDKVIRFLRDGRAEHALQTLRAAAERAESFPADPEDVPFQVKFTEKANELLEQMKEDAREAEIVKSAEGAEIEVGTDVWVPAYARFVGSGETAYVPKLRRVAEFKFDGAFFTFEDGGVGLPQSSFKSKRECWLYCAQVNDEEAEGSEEEAKEYRHWAKRIRSAAATNSFEALERSLMPPSDEELPERG